MARNALGRGLGALIRELEGKRSEPAPPPPQPQATATNASAVAAMPARQATQGGPQEIDIDLIEPSPYQPRTKFHEQALDELARSIKTSGIIQPLVLRPIGSRFQLIAGERRWRAAQRAGLNKVSAIVRQVPDELALDKQIQEWIEEGKLSAGHGRALLAVPEQQLRMRYAHRASRGALTVRQIEKLAARRAQGKQPHPSAPAHLDANIKNALEELQRHLGTRISLRQRTKIRPGQLVLEFYDDKQLMGLYDRLMK